MHRAAPIINKKARKGEILMKKKNFLSMLMALAMTVPTVIPVSAETAVTAQPTSGYSCTEWPTIWYSSGDETNFPSSSPDRTMNPQITLDDSKTGDSSIYMKFPTSNHAYCMHFFSKQTATLESGKTYVIGAWMKGLDSRKGGTMYFGLDGWARVDLASAVKTDENGWTLYQKEFTADKDYTNKRALLQADKIYGDNCVILVDDVFIYEKGSDVNLVDNPSFASCPTSRARISKGRQALRSSVGWADYTAATKCTFYAQPVTGDGSVYEGEKAAYIYRANGYNTENTYLQYGAAGTIVAGEPYTVTFYIKGTYEENQTFIGPASIRLTDPSWTKTYAGNGWTKYTGTQTRTSDTTTINFYMSSWVKEAAFYLDGLSVKDSSGKEYCPNGGFEDCYVYEEGMPEMFVATSASNVNKNKGVVAWTNPQKSDITDITLTVNGTEIEFTPDTASQAYNHVVLENLGEHISYNCVLSITAGGKTYTSSRVLVAHTSDMYYNAAGNRVISPDWTLARNETEGNYCNTVLEIDKEIKASGNSSMKVTCGRSGTATNTYASLVQGVQLEKNKTYQFSAKIRYMGSTNFKVQGIYNTSNGWENSAPINPVNERERWKTYTYDIAAYDGEADDGEMYTRTLQFIFDNKADAVWIDDVAIYEVSEGVVNTSKNFIKNGGFEYDTEWASTSTNYQLTYNGEVVADIEALESGEVLGSIGIKNYEKEDLNVTVVAAVYEDGKLVDVSFAEKDVPVLANPFVTPTVGTSVTVPEFAEGKKYEMKLMLLDSMNNLKPLRNADIFK